MQQIEEKFTWIGSQIADIRSLMRIVKYLGFTSLEIDFLFPKHGQVSYAGGK